MPSCPGLFLVLSCFSRDSTSAGKLLWCVRLRLYPG